MTRPVVGPSVSSRTGRYRSRWLMLAASLGVLIALLVVGGGGWYLFLRPAGAPPVHLASGAAFPAAADGAALGPGSLQGSWTVNPSIDSGASGSFVGYRVQEQLAGVGAHTAVGRTANVSGSFTLSGTTVTRATFTADLATLKSNEPLRDAQLAHRGLQTATFPTARFVLEAPIALGAIPAPGAVIHATADGRLTLHGETRSVAIPLQARLSGGVIEITGSLPIVFADYGIVPPTSFIALSVAHQGILELQLWCTHA